MQVADERASAGPMGITHAPVQDSGATALITRVVLRPGSEKAFAAWHGRMATSPAVFPGFISTEVVPPGASGGPYWSIVQNFRSAAEMRAWRQSEAHGRLVEEAQLLTGDEGLPVAELQGVELKSEQTVTEVINTLVKPGQEEAYREWSARIHELEAQFPGYRGGLLQPPSSSKQAHWMTLVRFATAQELDNWLASKERQDLLREHEDIVERWESHRMATAFAGWFPMQTPDREAPDTLKQSLVVLLVLFPIVMGELRFLSPMLTGINSAAATFVGNAVSVALIAWPMMPIAIWFLNWWLSPKKGAASWIQPMGFVVMFVLYASELFALWHFL